MSDALLKCTYCKAFLPNECFSSVSGTSRGVRYGCKKCCSSRARAWNLKNRERHNATCKRYALRNPKARKEYLEIYRSENREKARKTTAQWVKDHPEQHRANTARWYKEHPHVSAANTARRHAAQLRATPSWANEFFISEAYDLARLRTQATGFKWHVDHIVPLRSKRVCGLHVENNLQVIPAVVNMKKQNRHWPDMPEESARVE